MGDRRRLVIIRQDESACDCGWDSDRNVKSGERVYGW
jgi:hypothetical protein